VKKEVSPFQAIEKAPNETDIDGSHSPLWSNRSCNILVMDDGFEFVERKKKCHCGTTN
jgi:hypothetical protein